MIPFFRKIRKKMADDNKPIKYLRYAIGEIVLVMIGILLALQVNNWNQNRIKFNESIKHLKSLKYDLEVDTIYFNQQKRESQKQVDNYRIFFKKSYETQNNIEEVTELIDLAYPLTNYLQVQKSTFSEMVNAGKLNDLANEELKSSIVALYRDYEIARLSNRDYNEYTVSLMEGLKFNIWKFLSGNRENLFDEEYMFHDNDWKFLNDYSSTKFQQFENMVTQYHGKQSDAIEMFDELKIKASLLIKEINDELNSH
ncbi:DUF6090 family protein [Gaetbulibacter aquiaggeris]|uniref:DUF6090 family protein n=1 Tax=Gaetbulibacter aquiaggeris TaxID=1735373 RepID=A0ABW7MSA7_9FLAO